MIAKKGAINKINSFQSKTVFLVFSLFVSPRKLERAIQKVTFCDSSKVVKYPSPICMYLRKQKTIYVPWLLYLKGNPELYCCL